MGQRKMTCTREIDLEMDQQGQGFLRPDPCIPLGSITALRQPDIQTMVSLGDTTNVNTHRVPECYDSGMFYGAQQYHGVQHHPHPHGPSIDLGAATASSFYVPYMTPTPGIPLSHGSSDQLPSSSHSGVIGISADEYGTNGHFMDSTRASFKRKNAEGNPVNFQCFNASASSSSFVAPFNTRHPEGIPPMEAASFTLPQFRGNTAPSMREVGSHRSLRDRLGAAGVDPALALNQNRFIPGSYLAHPFQPGPSLWLDQQLSNSTSDAGNNFSGSLIETGSMGPQRYLEPASNISNTGFLHPPHVNHQRHNFTHLSPLVRGIRGRNNVNLVPELPSASFRPPTTYPSQSIVNPSQDGFDTGPRHLGVQSAGLRLYQPHREGVVSETMQRHHNLPRLRVVPTDGVAVLEFPDYYEVENYIDHHRDMRMDIEDMSYEELLALGERIGNVSTGLSDETIRCQLRTRTYLASPTSINLEEVACVDHKPDSCIICQDDYKSLEKIGTLGCGHEYHAECLKKWLRLKNVCPICKSEALPTERKVV